VKLVVFGLSLLLQNGGNEIHFVVKSVEFVKVKSGGAWSHEVTSSLL